MSSSTRSRARCSATRSAPHAALRPCASRIQRADVPLPEGARRLTGALRKEASEIRRIVESQDVHDFTNGHRRIAQLPLRLDEQAQQHDRRLSGCHEASPAQARFGHVEGARKRRYSSTRDSAGRLPLEIAPPSAVAARLSYVLGETISLGSLPLAWNAPG